MQLKPDRLVGREAEPIRVLLVGERWEQVAPVIEALSNQGSFRFSRPIKESEFTGIKAANQNSDPSVITVGPDVDTRGLDLGLDQRRDRENPPPLLACITHEGLESAALYEDADDFLVVPCSAAEMGMRLRRLALKSLDDGVAPVLTVGDISLDLTTYQVTVGNVRVGLAWLEFQLLKFLMENVDKVFSREQLLANVWGVESFGGTRTVDVHIRRLRNKVEIHGHTYFRTVKNVGYGMTLPT